MNISLRKMHGIPSWQKGISDRRVLQYCNTNRIDEAIKMGNTWLIPKTSVKPIDGRIKQGKEHKHGGNLDCR